MRSCPEGELGGLVSFVLSFPPGFSELGEHHFWLKGSSGRGYFRAVLVTNADRGTVDFLFSWHLSKFIWLRN